jgi:tRNA-uridine 2-sulfurtransferase
MKKVVLGFSGGVDSAVCAKLLKDAGFDVHGLYMDNTDEKALSVAVGTAEFIGIPLEVRDVHRELDSLVCSRFAESYLRGETPNPCIICNPTLKFKTLLDFANEIGADNIATGHYARAENGVLYKGMPSNDQSYMLCRIRKEQLDRLILPLGKFEKTQVRKLAEGFNLPVAHKPDSMEICFIPDKDYISWLAGRAELPPAGDFVFHGEVVGRHDGIYRYTVGQRRPGLYDGRKLYISAINAEKNEIELALWEELFKTQVIAKNFNWLCDEPNGPVRATVRVRHTKWENPPCTAYIEGDTVKIVCDEPVRAPARGQSAVLYNGDRVLGGGFIM